jgi:hypothetical protein
MPTTKAGATAHDPPSKESLLSTTTFGFDAVQDRIWMRMHEQDVTLWLTRRMVSGILGPMVTAFENATPGEQGGSMAPARAAIEHHLALHETTPGQAAPQIRAGHVPPSQDSDPQQNLCTSVNARANQDAMVMRFDSAAGPLVVSLSRKGMHLWLRGLTMVLRQAQWGIPTELPPWLTAGLMPPAMQSLLQKPLPDDLDDADLGEK